MSLELTGVSVRLGGHDVVRDVDLTVGEGELVGLLGPNGSGKSSLLKCLYRVHRPSAGVLRLDGHDLLVLPPRDAARRIAVVTQDAALEFDATVAEVVSVGRFPYQRAFALDDDGDRAAVHAALVDTGMTGFENRSMVTLSGGERQRVFIARALAQGCDHLLLDEPTNHLDIRYQIEVLELLRAQCARGVAVVAALHDLSLAGQYCDRIYLMHAGRVVAHGTPADVITADRVREVYGADVLVREHPETGRPYVVPRPVAHLTHPKENR